MTGEIVLRPVDVDRDVDIAFSVVTACEQQCLGRTITTRDEVVSMLTGPQAWRDAHRVAELDGSAVGVAILELEAENRDVDVEAFGIGPRVAEVESALVAYAVDRGLAQADAAPGSLSDADPFTLSPGIWQLTASTVVGEQPYSEVLDAAGFRVIRHFWHLRRPVSGADAQAPATPPGASVRVVDPAADRALLARLRNESFAEHFGWHEMSVAEYWDVIESMPRRNPATRWIAELDGEPVGFVLLDDSRAERNRGWVRSIGVLREARGRGIARWLLRLANADALARGYDSIGLGVDSANVTGATALYESEGYVVDEAIDAWLLPLTAETP